MNLAPLSHESCPVPGSLLDALRAEREALRQSLGALAVQPAVPLVGGVRLFAEPGACVYRFETDLELLLPDGTGVTIEAKGLRAGGEVTDHDPGLGSLECVLRENLGDSLPEARLEFGSTALLDLLIARLEELARGISPDLGPACPERRRLEQAFAFLSGEARAGAPVELSRAGLSESQAAAVGFLLGQRVGYLWGPPGTGKTRTVGHLVHALVDRGERVLLTAHTNIATDTALLRFLDEGLLEPGQVVRVGYRCEALERFGVGLDEVVHRQVRAEQPSLALDIRELCLELAGAAQRPLPDLLSPRTPLGRMLRMAKEAARGADGLDPALARRLGELLEAVEKAERRAVEGAAVVASTLTGLYTKRVLRGLRTDALVLDEASIASLALCLVAAYAADTRAIAVGDFMQLPAIVRAEQPAARKWLGSHVFASAGCDRPDSEHPLRVMLDEQHRMAPQISATVSQVFYGGRLRDAGSVRARAEPGPAVLLLDTSRLGARTELSPSSSKRNPGHAELVARLVETASSREIAVIAPYRAQVRAVRDRLRERAPKLLSTGRVEVFTVHRFQGRDKELVFFDTTEGPGSLCRFLDENHNPDAPNLVNVALSRARRRLVVVANLAHLTARLGRHSMLGRVLASLRLGGCLELEAGDPRDEEALGRFLESKEGPADTELSRSS